MRHTAHLLLSCCLLPVSVQAQSVTATAITQGHSLSIAVAGQIVQTAATPAGVPLASASRSLVNTSPLAVGSISGTLTVGEPEVLMMVNHALVCTNTTTVAAASDTLLTVNVTRPIRARVELEWQGILPVGAVLPVVSLDVDNDGTVDMLGAPNRVVSQVYNLTGSHACLLHVDGSQQAGAGGTLTAGRWTAYVRVVPEPTNITVQPMLPGCTTYYELRVRPAFHGGLEVSRSRPAMPQPAALDLLVVGFTPVFAPLPLANCFLVPAPDLLFYASSMPVQLGPTLAPLQFYVQSVTLSLNALASNSFLVRMN